MAMAQPKPIGEILPAQLKQLLVARQLLSFAKQSNISSMNLQRSNLSRMASLSGEILRHKQIQILMLYFNTLGEFGTIYSMEVSSTVIGLLPSEASALSTQA